ncbi:MAG: hypothetical protein E6H66_21970 [Betaproteobacteria bacterium]|nr:MAG: hypothetical protein E6H66_21970 [Betaproteobacteria bacterium]
MALTPGVWVSIGPTRINEGGLGAIGRIHSIAIHPTTPATMYVGAPRCGIWKTTNGGAAWTPVGDSLPTLALAALAVDPVTPARVYAVLAGAAIYRSEDAAVSWTLVHGDLGTPAGAGVLLIDPTIPSHVYLTGSDGLYRSTDSGANWTRVKTGLVNDVVMDPSNPAILYAGVQNDGVYKTTTGGAAGDSAWTKLSGLPTSGFTRITLGLCRAVPTTIFAGLSGSPFRVFRSTDGARFSLRFTAASSIYNPWMGVDPADPSIVYVLSAQFLRSTDGGASFAPTSGDTHECQKFALDPVTPGVIYLGRDNGFFRSQDRGATWAQTGGGIANVEFYDGALAATDPNLMIGGTQDNGTIRYDGSSTVWNEIQDGDGGTVAIDPTSEQILYAMGQYASSITRSTNGGSSFGGFAAGLPTGSVCFNLQFLVHPTTPTTLLAACTSLWRITSPTGAWTTIFTPPGDSIVRAAVEPSVDLYYAGSGSGKLYAGPGGASWQQVFAHPNSAGFKDLRVDPDNHTIVYATLGGISVGRVYRMARSSAAPTSVSASDITSNLPAGLSANTIAVDRMAPFTVYVGTDRGVFQGVSINQGATWNWSSYNSSLPFPNVVDLEVHPASGVMRAATFGRSAYEVHTDWPIGTLAAAQGRITFLRVHDVGTGWGPPTDFLDVEVVLMLDTLPGRGFGFQLRADSEEAARHAMLDLLRDAFDRNGRVTIDYVKTGLRNGRILRVADLS